MLVVSILVNCRLKDQVPGYHYLLRVFRVLWGYMNPCHKKEEKN